MSKLNVALYEFLLDTENPSLNYNLALEYDALNQTASAITYYLRSAERTEIVEDAYECLLRVGNCFNKQGNRKNSVQKTYKQALTLMPKRPEAYLCLAKFFEINNENADAYVFADLGLKLCDFNLPALRGNVCHPLTDCYSGLLLEKAICSWGWGKNDETRQLFKLIHENYYDTFNVDYQQIIKNNLVKIKLVKNQVIDCFVFNGEKELLEIRYSLLKDKVDKFIIIGRDNSELSINQYITDLDLPADKFKIISLDSRSKEYDKINFEFDNLSEDIKRLYENKENVNSEIALFDTLTHYVSEYADDDIFLISDISEIIKPGMLDHFCNMARTYSDRLIKVPLIELYGSANLRLYNNNADVPVKADQLLLICTKKHLCKAKPSHLRFNINNPYEIVYVTQNGVKIEDCGWHFSMIEDSDREQLKDELILENDYKFKEYAVKDLPSFIFSKTSLYEYFIGKSKFRLKDVVLDKSLINAVDMSYSQNYLHKKAKMDKNFNGLLDDAGKEAYKLYSYFSEKLNNSIILDIGSYLGNSAIALSKNPSNTVISYDLEDTGVKDIHRENIIWKTMNFMEDHIDYKNVKLILIDIDPHTGVEEIKMIKFLKEIGWKGILLLNDIHLNDEMNNFWNSLNLNNKLDVTPIGHYSGTGLVFFD